MKAETDLNLSLPTGMPEPLLTEVVMSSVGSALEGSVTFGFREISQDFVEQLKTANLYTSDVAIQSAAIAYHHVNELVTAIKNCPSRAIGCQVEKFAKSEANDVLGFKGWSSRIAQYDYQLKMLQDGLLTRAEVEQTDRPDSP